MRVGVGERKLDALLYENSIAFWYRAWSILTLYKVNLKGDETDKERNFSLRFMTGMEARKKLQVARLARLSFVSLRIN